MSFELPSTFFNSDVLASACLLLGLLASRMIAGRALLRRDDITEKVARWWTANVRNVLILVAVVGLIMIWAPQLRTFALSLTAVAVAIVVATKELILCLSGAALRTFTRAFSVGDIIEVGATKGEVLDLNLLATQLREFESIDGSVVPTGRIVTLPYSLLFSSPAKVLPHSRASIEHAFTMTFEPDVNLFSRVHELRAIAVEALAKTVATEGNSSSSQVTAERCDIELGTSDIGKYRLRITLHGAREPRSAENAVACAIGAFIEAQRTSSSTE